VQNSGTTPSEIALNAFRTSKLRFKLENKVAMPTSLKNNSFLQKQTNQGAE
jgi:hypothetical protein